MLIKRRWDTEVYLLVGVIGLIGIPILLFYTLYIFTLPICVFLVGRSIIGIIFNRLWVEGDVERRPALDRKEYILCNVLGLLCLASYIVLTAVKGLPWYCYLLVGAGLIAGVLQMIIQLRRNRTQKASGAATSNA